MAYRVSPKDPGRGSWARGHGRLHHAAAAMGSRLPVGTSTDLARAPAVAPAHAVPAVGPVLAIGLDGPLLHDVSTCPDPLRCAAACAPHGSRIPVALRAVLCDRPVD